MVTNAIPVVGKSATGVSLEVLFDVDEVLQPIIEILLINNRAVLFPFIVCSIGW
ncbi:hypothetical protein THOE12_20112 [Vibrio rotiferianus]|nr:hypothetical protein THOE12_20112 [Vibrio rotiferianus]